MKRTRGKQLGIAVALGMSLMVWQAISARAAGLMKPVSGGDTDALSIRSHDVRVVVNNGFARTEVDQVFFNSSAEDKEAIYTFPLPKEASLSEVSLWINGEEVVGEVLPREQARQVYEEEKQKGNDTALAEKQGFKSFDIAVGLLRAQSDTRVRLVYYQPLDIDLNIGRYLYPLAEGGTDEERPAFWSVDSAVSGRFSFHMTLKSAFPIRDVRVPGYMQLAMIQQDDNATGTGLQDRGAYDITIEQAEGAALTKDVVVYYRLDDQVPARVEMIPFRSPGQNEGTFMVVVTPAASLAPIQEGIDWTFVLDVSGSMAGHKISALADGVAQVVGRLTPNDRFRIVTFSNKATDISAGYVSATPEQVATWTARIRALRTEGGTALFEGLREGYSGLDADRTTGFVLVTDGVCNIGPTHHRAFHELTRQYDVRLFTIVVGNSANQPLMEQLAQESGGFALNLSTSDDIVGRLLQAKARVLHDCMHDVHLNFKGERVSDLTPSRLPALYMGQQAVLFGHYSDAGEATLTMTARISGAVHTWECPVTFPETDQDNPELERLWALARINELMKEIRIEEKDALKARVRDLGVEYSLVTDYTSMLVVCDDVFEDKQITRRNAQRVEHERQAQVNRAAAPAPPPSRRVDNGTTFGDRSAPGLGSGPVGPLFCLVAAWARRRSRRNDQDPN
ncbi:MAG: VWA domain-containing protein [Lentisphaerae bacterium]|nr:VWA domain-containing protein [Lentisphaerota bacterium]